jgi:hypothetical protein
MEDYNRMISSRILGNVDGMIDTLPQPTMFGGKRQRDFVLPASTEYDYPATLSVGHLNTSGMPRTLGGSFWTDFGEKEYLDEDNDEYQLEGGAVYIGEDGQVHSTGRIMPRNMVGADPRTYTPMGLKKVGGKINKRLLEGVLKVATKTGTTLALTSTADFGTDMFIESNNWEVSWVYNSSSSVTITLPSSFTDLSIQLYEYL